MFYTEYDEHDEEETRLKEDLDNILKGETHSSCSSCDRTIQPYNTDDSEFAPVKPSTSTSTSTSTSKSEIKSSKKERKIDSKIPNDIIIQFYIGTLCVLGIFLLYKVNSKNI